jgi:hypothetical protein
MMPSVAGFTLAQDCGRYSLFRGVGRISLIGTCAPLRRFRLGQYSIEDRRGVSLTVVS